ncbi:TPA: hypothetical protein R5E59_003398 [Enterobacter cloacae]|nr:hypothetical protein [Enterobacter cloacae]
MPNSKLCLNISLVILSLMLSGCVIRDHHSTDRHHPDHHHWHHDPSHAHGWHDFHGHHGHH